MSLKAAGFYKGSASQSVWTNDLDWRGALVREQKQQFQYLIAKPKDYKLRVTNGPSPINKG